MVNEIVGSGLQDKLRLTNKYLIKDRKWLIWYLKEIQDRRLMSCVRGICKRQGGLGAVATVELDISSWILRISKTFVYKLV